MTTISIIKKIYAILSMPYIKDYVALNVFEGDYGYKQCAVINSCTATMFCLVNLTKYVINEQQAIVINDIENNIDLFSELKLLADELTNYDDGSEVAHSLYRHQKVLVDLERYVSMFEEVI